MATHERISSTLLRMEGELRRAARHDGDQEKRRDLEFRANTLRQAVELLKAQYTVEPCTACAESQGFAVEALTKLATHKMNSETEIKRLNQIIKIKSHDLKEGRPAPSNGHRWPQLIEAYNASELTQREFCRQEGINLEQFKWQLRRSRPSGDPSMPRWKNLYSLSDPSDRRILWVFAAATGRYFSLHPHDLFASSGKSTATDARHIAMALLDHFCCTAPLLVFRLMVSNTDKPLTKYAYTVIRGRFPIEWGEMLGDIKRVLGHAQLPLDDTDIMKLEAEYGSEQA